MEHIFALFEDQVKVEQEEDTITVQLPGPTGEEEDDVTPASEMPKWLLLDRLSGKYIFRLGVFDWKSIPAALSLTDLNKVKEMAWSDFNKATGKMVAQFYDELNKYYKSGLSAKWRRSFCAVLSSRLPVMETKYFAFRQQSAKGTLTPDLSGSVKSMTSYADFLYARLEKHCRYQLKKDAEERGVELRVKKRNGSWVAENNRKRKKLKEQQENAPDADDEEDHRL